MRCPSCNLFCSTEASEPSVDDITVDIDDGFGPKDVGEAIRAAWKSGDPSFLTVKAVVSIEKTSECCGDDVASATVEIEEEIVDEEVLKAVLAHLAKPLGEDEEHDLEIEVDGATYVESGTGKRDDPYVERVDVEWHITCCGEKFGSGMVSGEIQEWEDA